MGDFININGTRVRKSYVISYVVDGTYVIVSYMNGDYVNISFDSEEDACTECALMDMSL